MIILMTLVTVERERDRQRQRQREKLLWSKLIAAAGVKIGIAD